MKEVSNSSFFVMATVTKASVFNLLFQADLSAQ